MNRNHEIELVRSCASRQKETLWLVGYRCPYRWHYGFHAPKAARSTKVPRCRSCGWRPTYSCAWVGKPWSCCIRICSAFWLSRISRSPRRRSAAVLSVARLFSYSFGIEMAKHQLLVLLGSGIRRYWNSNWYLNSKSGDLD